MLLQRRVQGCISLGTIHMKINQYLGPGLLPSRALLPRCTSQEEEKYRVQPWIHFSPLRAAVKSRRRDIKVFLSG